MNQLILAVTTGLLVGCASGKPVLTPDCIPAPEICRPMPGAGLFCVYRNEIGRLGYGSLDTAEVLIDGFPSASLELNRWVEVTVSPGNHWLGASAPQYSGASLAPYELGSGEVRYFHLWMGPGGGVWRGGGPFITIQPVDEARARSEIKNDCRAGPKVTMSVVEASDTGERRFDVRPSCSPVEPRPALLRAPTLSSVPAEKRVEIPTVKFGAVPVGSASAAMSFTVTNPHDTATQPFTIAVSGANATDFQVIGGPTACGGVVLSPAGTCTVSLTFTPLSAGPRAALLDIDGGPGASSSVLLAGSGM